MEPSPDTDQESLIPVGSPEALGGEQPTTSETLVLPPGNQGVSSDGDAKLSDDRADYDLGEAGGDGTAAIDSSDAAEKIRPFSELEASASSAVSIGNERENALREGDELPMGDLPVDQDSAEAALPSVSVGDGRQAEGGTDIEQSQAQGQAAEVENTHPCKICFTNLEPQEFIYLNCGCLYCVECLNNHFRSGLANRASYPPICCDRLPIDVEAVQGFLDDENMIRYTMVREEFAAGRPIFCANKECSVDFIGDVAQIDLQSDQRMIICYSCALETCARCRELRYAHADNEGVLECPDSLALANVKEIAEEENWRRCPGCRFLVEKIDGCDHMICDCRIEFHYLCGGEYSDDGRCGCTRNPDWDDVEQDGGWDHAGEPDAGSEEEFEHDLPLHVQDDLHRPDEFPFVLEHNRLDREHALLGITADTEMLLMEYEAEGDAGDADDAGDATGTTQDVQEEVIDVEGERHDPEVREIIETREAHDTIGGQEHQMGEVPADQMEEESQNDEDENLVTAKETLRTALTGFRNATGELRTAAAVVVNARRRRAQRALRQLQRVDGADRPRIRGAGRRGRGGRGRGGRGGGIAPIGNDNGNGQGEEQEHGDQ